VERHELRSDSYTGSYSLGRAMTARADSSVLKNMKEEVVAWRIVCYMLRVLKLCKCQERRGCLWTVCCCHVLDVYIQMEIGEY
jgi:hypothetical protein